MAEKMKKDTAAFKKKMLEQAEKAKVAAQKQMEKDKAEADKARERRIAAAKAEREADEKEHQAALEARRKLDEQQAAAHKKAMLEKKAEFEKTFKHLWGPGATGQSVIYCTLEDKETADKVITAAFQDTMVAQATSYPDVTYKSKNETKLHMTKTGLHIKQNENRIEMYTSDDRVPELIETAISTSDKENLDIIVVSMAAISPDYKDWVSLQSTEQDQTNAYYNVAAFGEGEEAIANKRVARMYDVMKNQEKAEGKAEASDDKKECCEKQMKP